jgi:hypothetical protein
MTLATHLLQTYVVSQTVRDHLAKAVAERGVEALREHDLPDDIMDRLVVQEAKPLTADELFPVKGGEGNRKTRRKMGSLDRRRPKRR